MSPTVRSPTYIELVSSPGTVPFSSFAPGTTEGMNAIVKFVTDGRTRPAAAGDQIGRDTFVKAEDPAFTVDLPVKVLGLTRDDMSFVNEILLPTVLTPDTKYRWTQYRFIPGALTNNPAMGVNYRHERVKEENEASAKRVGQHFEIEGDAWYTEAGQRDFKWNIAYWAVTLADTLAMRSWAELVRDRVETKRSYFNNIQNERYYTQAVLKQRNDSFAAYKSMKGIYRFVQEQCEIMATTTNGKEANIFVMPRDKSALITNGTGMTNYSNGGERGLNMLMSRGYLGEIVPGVQVYSPPTFSTTPAYNSSTPLDSEIRIGSHHLAKFARTQGELDFDLYQCLDKLYDENEDRWKSLPSLPECLKKCGRFSADGTLQIPRHPAALADKDDPFYDLYKAGVAVKKDWDGWAKWCVDEGCRFLTIAPFAGYRTQGTLLAASGAEAGMTTMSVPIVTKGQNAMTQVMMFNMTCWMGAYVLEPNRFLITHNVFYNGMTGGGGVTLISDAESDLLKGVKEWEDNRDNRPSIYFLVIGENGEINPNFIDLRGASRFGNEQTFPCAAFYSHRHGWDQIDDGLNEHARQPIAPLCFRREYNRWTKTEYGYSPGDTHHGRVVGVGSREIRAYGRCVVDNIVTQATRD